MYCLQNMALVLTADEHCAYGEYFLGVCVWRHVSKPHRGDGGEGEVQGRHVPALKHTREYAYQCSPRPADIQEWGGGQTGHACHVPRNERSDMTAPTRIPGYGFMRWSERVYMRHAQRKHCGTYNIPPHPTHLPTLRNLQQTAHSTYQIHCVWIQ